MDLLLHICCAPCSIFSWEYFSGRGYNLQGFFFNPNIHPYREFSRRLGALQKIAHKQNRPIFFNYCYPLEDFLHKIIAAKKDRCRICYQIRLMQTALQAKNLGIDHISTTMLISPYQKHDLLKRTGEKLAASFGLNFVYADLRFGFAQSMEKARAEELYRQSYCGCIFSEKDRYCKTKKNSGESFIDLPSESGKADFLR